jgi:hypothetical protein
MADEPHLRLISVPGSVCTLAQEAPDRSCRNKVIGAWEYLKGWASLSARRIRRRSVAIDHMNLNLPATFSRLDLQEVSQSCPAETLFDRRLIWMRLELSLHDQKSAIK